MGYKTEYFSGNINGDINQQSEDNYGRWWFNQI